MKTTDAAKELPWLLIAYATASFVHFAHNAEYLHDYPNLPGWLSRSGVYLSWFGIAAIGVAGYFVFRRVHSMLGLSILAVYAALGFDGLLHYGRAPFAAHSTIMNATIWVEVTAAALLLLSIIRHAANGARRGERVTGD